MALIYRITFKQRILVGALFILALFSFIFLQENYPGRTFLKFLLAAFGFFTLVWYAEASATNLSNLVKEVLALGAAAFYASICLAWWTGTQFHGKVIADSTLAAISTAMYAILTYFMLTSNRALFDIARLPSLVIMAEGRKIRIMNESKEHEAEHVTVEVELVYPVPEKFLDRILFITKRGIKRHLRVPTRNERWYKIPKILPSESAALDFTMFIKDKLGLHETPGAKEVPRENGHMAPTKGEKSHVLPIPLRSDKEVRFGLAIRVSSETDTGYESPKEEAIFYYTSDPHGCRLEKEEAQVVRIL